MRFLATSSIAMLASLAIVSAAVAQVVVPPGQDFEATPMSKGEMMSMPQAKIAMPAPPAKKMMKHKMKKKMMKTKMMKMKKKM